ncbi:hypothetical protein K466DRAFT_590224 [Polyporus arcularius HHB13444]|uniref:Nephrocystin 3-like N-terminal domain-containing protein n=1 Tax=Polyporus arcularius HHB13444 TaxID=1314778 RepID=A0A5C3P010_9APHY|nr:hypothetical protein K466DRAFT_590224 [Polyporus arcularius HHB13444]
MPVLARHGRGTLGPAAKPIRKLAKDARTVTDALNNLQTVLDKSRDLLSFAPVPGLSAALSVLLAIGEQIKKMKSNGETVKAISEQIRKLNDVVEKVVRQVESRAERLQILPEQRGEMLDCMQAPGGWRERVNQLAGELSELLKKAEPCAEGPWYRRLFRSIRDEETLKTIHEDLTAVIQHFLLAGGLSIEALTEQSLALIETMHGDIKMLAAAQKAEAVTRTQERTRQQAERERMAIETIPHANNAGFNSAGNADKSSYLAGTRNAVFDRLDQWVSSELSICFLVGAAGMGKSTIASEFCRRHQRELGASFFFRRGDARVGSTTAFFSTLAYQLAKSSKQLRPHIVHAAERHMQAGNTQQMQYVVDDLLHTPLRAAKVAGVHFRVYVVVDALDECMESASQPDLVPECLRLLVSCALQHPFIRLLITSRPEPDYVGQALRRQPELKDSSVSISLYNVEDRLAIDRDIGEIIRTRLCAVQEGAEWYRRDESVVSRLTNQSQGVFVYARTAVDFIVRAAGIAQMEHRLALLLTPGNTYGLDHLDLLYRTVLEAAFPPADLDPVTRERVGLMLAWVALCQYRYGVTPHRVQMVSGISCRESVPILTKLRSVIVFNLEAKDVREARFRAMHVTFRDFLVDRARCGELYHVDPQRMHARLAVDCLTFMRNNPRRDLVLSSKSDGVIYPVFNWMDHVVQASPTRELVGLLYEMYTSTPTGRTSLPVFFCRERFSEYGGGSSLLRWVDMHIGRDLAKTMGEQMCLENQDLTVRFGEEITVSKRSPGSQEGLTVHEDRQRRDIWSSYIRPEVTSTPSPAPSPPAVHPARVRRPDRRGSPASRSRPVQGHSTLQEHKSHASQGSLGYTKSRSRYSGGVAHAASSASRRQGGTMTRPPSR